MASFPRGRRRDRRHGHHRRGHPLKYDEGLAGGSGWKRSWLLHWSERASSRLNHQGLHVIQKFEIQERSWTRAVQHSTSYFKRILF